jgi:drug/metabolite transporter (DMT)-like permease
MKRRTLKADALLLATAMIWGLAFVAQRAGMEHIGPFTFNGIRFALGALSLLPLWLAGRVGRTAKRPAPPGGARWTLLGGLAAGLALFLGATLQQVGIVYTTAGKAGFITGLYVVLVPILGLLWRHRLGPGGWAGALAAAGGLYLLSVREDLSIGLGDSLVLVGAFFWAAHVLIIGRFTSRVAAIDLAALQFSICSALSLVMMAILERPTLDGIAAAAVPILYGGIFSVGVAFTLQVFAQRDAGPTATAILLSLEAVFAALGGWVLLGETLSPRAILGCGLMLGGVLLSQLGRGADSIQEYVETRTT